jgi:hypothetical protein
MTKILTLCIQAELLTWLYPVDRVQDLEAKRIIGLWEQQGI